MNDIKLIVFDVDGTLTDGGIIIFGDGVEVKRFSDADGLIIRRLPEIGYITAIITGRVSPPVNVRARDLCITMLYHGVNDKVAILSEMCEKACVSLAQTAFIGNDLNDYAAMRLCGWKACPADAAREIKELCDYVSEYNGGHGAVRDILERLLKHCDKYDDMLRLFGVIE
jgi:3-deoxy-D-manno-octulosonate 8-phosphate phosphatase (KDO 8-P phosphatase)